MFFNAGREVGLVFESKNIMVNWLIFFLVHLTCRMPVECERDDLHRREKSDLDLRHLRI